MHVHPRMAGHPRLLPMPLVYSPSLWKQGKIFFIFSAIIFHLNNENHRPDLTWRDIQHLCIESARILNPEDPDWERTSAGRLYSYKYGFGVLDAASYIKAAKNWRLVKPQAWFETETVQIEGGTMLVAEKYSGGQPIVPGGVKSSLTITSQLLQEKNFEKLEHIQVKVWISHAKRGDVEVEIVSPNGIRSVLGGKRAQDKATSGYPGWIFMTVKHWLVLNLYTK